MHPPLNDLGFPQLAALKLPNGSSRLRRTPLAPALMAAANSFNASGSPGWSWGDPRLKRRGNGGAGLQGHLIILKVVATYRVPAHFKLKSSHLIVPGPDTISLVMNCLDSLAAWFAPPPPDDPIPRMVEEIGRYLVASSHTWPSVQRIDRERWAGDLLADGITHIPHPRLVTTHAEVLVCNRVNEMIHDAARARAKKDGDRWGEKYGRLAGTRDPRPAGANRSFGKAPLQGVQASALRERADRPRLMRGLSGYRGAASASWHQ